MAVKTSSFHDKFYNWTVQIPAGWEVTHEPFDDFEVPDEISNPPFQELIISPPDAANGDEFSLSLSNITCWSLPLYDEMTPAEMIEEEIEDTLATIKEEGGDSITLTQDTVNIAHVEFHRIEAFDKDDEYGFLNNIYLLAEIDGYILRIEVVYDNLEDRKTMWQVIEDSQFKK